VLLAEEDQITRWVDDGLTVVKIGILSRRRGVAVSHRTLARFSVERCGAGRRTTTARVDDPVGAENSIQAIDQGILCGWSGRQDRYAWAIWTVQFPLACAQTWVLRASDLR